MSWKAYAIPISCIIVLSTVAPLAAQGLDLEALIDEALANNPGLSTLKHRWEAFEARVPQAGALDDPTFRFEASNLPLRSFDYTSTPMTGNQLVLSQKIPFPGTRSARERAARHASAAAEHAYLDREGFIANGVKRAYFSLAFLDRAIAITRENEVLLRDFVRIAQTKYAVGKGLQHDVLKAQVAVSALKNKLIRLGAMRRTAGARLNLVLNRPPQSPVGMPGKVVLTELSMSTDEIRQTALANRPKLQAIQQTIQQWAATGEAARRQLWPNVNFSLGYRQRAFMPGDPVGGSDFLSFGVGINLPVFRGRKQRQKVAEAQANARMAESRHEAAAQEILYKVEALYLEVQQHRDESELFRTAILPQARQSLESAMAGYQVDKVDFLALLNNQVTLLNFEIDYYRHVTEHEKKLAELEAVVGKRLF